MTATLRTHRLACQVCDGATLREIPAFTALHRVTSDSKPFRPGGRLFVCVACGAVQKTTDAQWLSEIGEIYRNYDMYHQSSAVDQTVFDPVTGQAAGRCEVLARRLLATGRLPPSGSLLDVGAGSGAMLAAFSRATSQWALYGFDLDERKRATLERIERFAHLYTGDTATIDRPFELVSLVHSLEHFTDPRAMLERLRNWIAPGGALFIEVNNVQAMAFDLVVADHLCHFSPRTLARLLESAGYRVLVCATDWIGKEISLLASPASGVGVAAGVDEENECARTARDVVWLSQIASDAAVQAATGNFGILGTSIAATWLAATLGGKVSFFVDEDAARRGHLHLGRPILQPEEAPADGVTYLAFPRARAEEIAARLGKRMRGRLALPPAAL